MFTDQIEQQMLQIGDKVVCVDAAKQPHTVEELTTDVPNWVVQGQEYTVRGFADYDFVLGIYLEEIVNPPRWFKLLNRSAEPAFKESRFRKLASAEKTEGGVEESVTGTEATL